MFAHLVCFLLLIAFSFVTSSASGITDDSLHRSTSSSMKEANNLTIGVIRFHGNHLFTAEAILSKFQTQPTELLEPSVLEADFGELLLHYERLGFPLAKIVLRDVTLADDNTLTLDIEIDEGSRLMISELDVEGNTETRDDVILRETRMALPASFDQERAAKIQERLNRLNIFSRVEEPELYLRNDSIGGLLIKVQEGSTNTFDGVVGYAPAAVPGENGSFTGIVNIGMRNLFGTGRRLRVRWQRDDRRSQEMVVQYTEPWIFRLPVNVSGSFFQRQQDTTYVRRQLDGKADLLLTESFSVSGIVGHESTIPSNTLSNQLIRKSTTVTFGIEASYDSRTDPISPVGGVNYRTEYRVGTKHISNLSSSDSSIKNHTTVQRVGIDIEHYLSFANAQVGLVGIHARQHTGGALEISDLYRFGGTNTLRGYRENQFLGSRIAWTNIEYRFLLARRSFVYGFFDTGYIYLPDEQRLGLASSQTVKYGYGIGIRLETALGNLGVSFALGEGDGFSDGKIHFGLINDF